jgi:PTH1 family peptidyl-tRNA hydrolase
VRIILGIGNPGKRYRFNRHNVGFMLLDYLAEKYALSFTPSKFDYLEASGNLAKKSYTLIRPTTYVNESGIAAADAIKNFGVELKDFLVIVDDVNLEFSKLRVRASGGDGGHNGLNSIIYRLSSDQFPRLRIGIGNSFQKGYMADYVLTDFDKNERKILEKTFNTAEILMEEFIKGGLESMLSANSRLFRSNKNKNIVN